MKVKITYTEQEEPLMHAIAEFVRVLFKGIKIRYSDRYPPYLHAYITATKQDESGLGNA